MRRASAFIGSGGRARAMFSTTVRASNTEKCWNTMPMPSSRASAGLWITVRAPFQKNSPLVGCMTP